MTTSEFVAWDIPIAPVPAARPRVTRWGTHYPEKYAKYRDQMAAWFTRLEDKHKRMLTGPLEVRVEFLCKRPAKPSKPYPQGDIDNYEKALFDAITKSGCLWKDDVQITISSAVKRYVIHPEEPMQRIMVTERKE